MHILNKILCPKQDGSWGHVYFMIMMMVMMIIIIIVIIIMK